MADDAPNPLQEFRAALLRGELAGATKIVRDGLCRTDAVAAIVVLLENETAWGRGALLAVGKVALNALGDRALACKAAEAAERVENWRTAAMLFRLAGDQARAQAAFEWHQENERRARRFREAASPVPTYFTPEVVPVRLRGEYNCAIEDEEFLEAAVTARNAIKGRDELLRRLYAVKKLVSAADRAQLAVNEAVYGLRERDVTHAAVLAYREALAHPESPLDDEGPDAPSDAELIRAEFGLTDKDLTA